MGCGGPSSALDYLAGSFSLGLRAMALATALLPSALFPDARSRSPRFSHADASFGAAFTARRYSEMASFGLGPVRKIARLNKAGT